MKRHDRARFVAFGVLPALNVVALLLYGLALATHGRGGAAASLPALVGIAAFCLLTMMAAAVKRGRDLGWPWWATLLGFWVSLGLGPVLPLAIAFMAFAKASPAADAVAPPAPAAGIGTWLLALLNLVWPWAVLAVLARIL